MGQKTIARSVGLATSALLGITMTGTAGPAGAEESPPAERQGAEVRLTATRYQPVAERAADWTAFPVPTSAAGLAEIKTAPDGAMWFVMEDANRVGRITPAGEVTEFDLPPTTSGEGKVQDLTVAADGTLWVVYDSGRRILGADVAAGTARDYVLGSFPYGEKVAMGPDGVPWVTMTFDEEGVSRVLPDGAFWHPNAPECEGAIAPGADGTMWCQDWDGLIALNGDASGGVRYPLAASATYPYSLAAGPTGSIWFARYSPSALWSPAKWGSVGWLDRASGQATVFETGSRTAPLSLVPGPGGTMWFTSIGQAAGIGHVDAQGKGALTKIAEYSPRFMTFGPDGNIWFTDEVNNVVVRVAPGALQVTNVDPGEKSVFTTAPPPGTQPPGTQPPGASPEPRGSDLGKVAVGKKPLKVRKRKVRVPISCPRSAESPCRGSLRLRHHKKNAALTSTKGYTVKPGRKKTIALTLTRKGRKAIKGTPTKVRATLLGPQGSGTRNKTIRVRR